ncbi:uncharacterized protein [Nicotiana sylvestris]|uniref:uncharacterized protein n=1 Tax=Nicotiana sylvestris TaxID=4096 RepID=UPI00388C97C1
MDAIIWNVKSVNAMQAFERLITMLRKHHFEFIGILEPMQQSHKMERYRARIGLAQVVVNVSNKIWAFIDEIFEVTILYNMTQQLTLRLTHTETHVELILTLVYAKCDRIERIELWDSLYAMASDMTVPWLVGGDFNVIWDEEEKFGGLPVSLTEEAYLHGGMEDHRKTAFLKDRTDVFAIMNCNRPFLDWSANHFCIFNYKLKKLKKALYTWSRATYGDIFQTIASLKEVVLVHERQFEVNPTQMNRKRLKLSRIQNSLGNWIEKDHLIAEKALKFYKDQFTKSDVPNAFDILNHVP